MTSSSARAGTSRTDPPPIPAGLLAAYRRSTYRAAGFRVRVGRRSAGGDAWLLAQDARAGAFVTAWNPRSRRMPHAWNQRMQLRLLQRLRRRPCQPGNSGERRWHEDQVLVAADPRQIATLAQHFRQNAILIVRRGQPARLRLL